MPAITTAAECPKFEPPSIRGKLASKKIDEASGIAPSHRNKGVFYVHNDSGDRPRFYAIDETGRDLGRYLLQGIVAEDWEDMAVGGAADHEGSRLRLRTERQVASRWQSESTGRIQLLGDQTPWPHPRFLWTRGD